MTSYPDVVFSTGFNGIAGWGQSSRGGARELPGPVLAQRKSVSEFYKEIRAESCIGELTWWANQQLANESYVITKIIWTDPTTFATPMEWTA